MLPKSPSIDNQLRHLSAMGVLQEVPGISNAIKCRLNGVTHLPQPRHANRLSRRDAVHIFTNRHHPTHNLVTGDQWQYRASQLAIGNVQVCSADAGRWAQCIT